MDLLIHRAQVIQTMITMTTKEHRIIFMKRKSPGESKTRTLIHQTQPNIFINKSVQSSELAGAADCDDVVDVEALVDDVAANGVVGGVDGEVHVDCVIYERVGGGDTVGPIISERFTLPLLSCLIRRRKRAEQVRGRTMSNVVGEEKDVGEAERTTNRRYSWQRSGGLINNPLKISDTVIRFRHQEPER
nr:hypothetical protein Iba_chr10eCG8420 [Ipomoea batatas]